MQVLYSKNSKILQTFQIIKQLIYSFCYLFTKMTNKFIDKNSKGVLQ